MPACNSASCTRHHQYRQCYLPWALRTSLTSPSKTHLARTGQCRPRQVSQERHISLKHRHTTVVRCSCRHMPRPIWALARIFHSRYRKYLQPMRIVHQGTIHRSWAVSCRFDLGNLAHNRTHHLMCKLHLTLVGLACLAGGITEQSIVACRHRARSAGGTRVSIAYSYSASLRRNCLSTTTRSTLAAVGAHTPCCGFAFKCIPACCE
jgi:hypothetical protein